MARPKGSTNKVKRADEPKPEPVKVAEVTPEKVVIHTVHSPVVAVYEKDCWVYSEDKPPFILRAGNPLPEGYFKEREKVRQMWVCDQFGKWYKG